MKRIRHKIKIEQDIIDKPVKLDTLNELPPQVNEIPRHFIHDVTPHRPYQNNQNEEVEEGKQ